MAAIDVSEVVSDVLLVISAVGAVGFAALMVHTSISMLRKVYLMLTGFDADTLSHPADALGDGVSGESVAAETPGVSARSEQASFEGRVLFSQDFDPEEEARFEAAEAAEHRAAIERIQNRDEPLDLTVRLGPGWK